MLAGNTADKTTLSKFLKKIESMYGEARRVWIMDRGIPTEATLQGMRDEKIGYLVGTPKIMLSKMQKELLGKPWEQVHDGMRVKLLEKENELYVLAQSEDRRKKENAMRRRKLKKLAHGLNRIKRAMKRRNVGRDTLLRRVAVLRKEAGRIASFVHVREPTACEEVSRKTFVCTFRRNEWRDAVQNDGSYILRAYLPWNDWPPEMEKQAPVLWEWYMQLTRVEEAFKTLKSDLGLRPIHHQLERRMEAHILVAFLGYCMQVTLREKLSRHCAGPDAARMFEGAGADPDAGRETSDHGWQDVDSATFHRAG